MSYGSTKQCVALAGIELRKLRACCATSRRLALPTPHGTWASTSRAWLDGHLARGVEGVVAKRLDHAYSPKRAWCKVRVRSSAEAIVGGVLGPISAPVALVLGAHDELGRLRVVGRTSPLPRAIRAELGAVLHPAGECHPWPPVLPPERFGGSRRLLLSSWPSTRPSTSSEGDRGGATQRCSCASERSCSRATSPRHRRPPLKR
jgi:hypothetical protein